jgi:co-chaperonin GroES (HSP10)
MKALIDLKPLHKWMIVRKDFREKSAGGVFIVRKTEERPITGLILSVGSEVQSPELQPGVRILFKYAAGTTFEYEGEKLAKIHEADVDGIVPLDAEVYRSKGLFAT